MEHIDRRSLLRGLGAAGSAALVACGGGYQAAGATTGREHRFTVTAEPAVIDLGAGITARTWTYGGRTPSRAMRITAGDTVAAVLDNQLPEATSVHWHGVPVRYHVDGAPPVTQPYVEPGETYGYRFTAPVPGTHYFHPHVGLQIDRGMYAPLIVEDPDEPLSYDDEWVILLDDWLDGITGTPDEAYAELAAGGGKLTLRQSTSPLMHGHAGDVNHPYHLINGRVPADPRVYTARPGTRVRMRVINAGADTAYRVALGGHRMTITHSDGYPVEHLTTDALLIGMGERYDALVTLGDGVFPLVAFAEGKNDTALALVRTGSGAGPSPTVRPRELYGAIATSAKLRATDEVRLEPRAPDRTYTIRLSGRMHPYDWTMNGKRFDMHHPTRDAYPVHAGERVRLEFINASGMWHPMHLHGHSYQLGTVGPRKDTAIVLPGERLTVNVDADNPGAWMMHCHNIYHGEAGMMALMLYTG
jgi:FtsP/CotA-like multicopper oxidase with cupredoxin domain